MNQTQKPNQQQCTDTTERPWGSFTVHGSFGTGHLKTLSVSAGGVLSLQRHGGRSEIWILLSGDAQAVRGQTLETVESFELELGVPFHIPVTHIHRLSSRNGGVLAEVSMGTFDEEDIERFEDIYGRNITA